MSQPNKPKICLFLPSLNMGGAERLTINLANEWNDLGYEVEFVIIKSHNVNDLSSLVSEDINISFLNKKRLINAIPSIRKHFLSSRPGVSLVAMWPLTVICVIAWLFSGKKGKLFLSDHTQMSISMLHEINSSKFIVQISIFLFYNLSSGVIAVSKGVKDDLCKLGRLNTDSVKVIHNPASLKKGSYKYHDNQDPFKKIWKKPGKKILAVGTLKEQKDFKTFIRAINEISSEIKVSAIIVGEGPERDDLQDLINQYDLSNRIFLAGFIMDPRIYFHFADLFVLSSAWEGFGNVIVEALENGTQVVSTNCKSGPSEILDNGRFGKLVPIKDHRAMADAIENSFLFDHDPEPLIERSKLYAVSKVAKKYIDYFLA